MLMLILTFGNIYLRSGENDLALQEYKYAISLAPTKAEIYNNTGVAYGNKKILTMQ